ncbi:MAG TPA: IclR family transcriptional regulator [Bacillota bacterium]|jgi:DNA-binding IclR family transcriptional regulator|nr:IclR family transcriptional regulator [Bacillota bacterium]
MIQSLDRGLEILFILSEHKSKGVTELANDLQVNKSTVFRLLETMEKRGLIQQDERTAKYRLGIGVLQISDGLVRNLDIISLSRPIMKQLMDSTKESVHLCTFSSDKVYVVDQVKSNYAMKVSAAIGQDEPIHCSSVGKCILAYLPEERIERILNETEFIPYTKKTKTTKEAIQKELAEIRAGGYAIDDEELSEGVRCLAAPIYNHRGEVKNCIGISGPSLRICLDNIDFYIDKIKAAADSISYSIGYRNSR